MCCNAYWLHCWGEEWFTTSILQGQQENDIVFGKFFDRKTRTTLWFLLEDMFQSIGTPQGIEKVTLQLKDTPTKVYAIGAKLFLLKVPIEVLQNWVLIQYISSYFQKCTGSNKRTVPNNRTLSCNWNRRVLWLKNKKPHAHVKKLPRKRFTTHDNIFWSTQLFYEV